jgi:hypothetical protein
MVGWRRSRAADLLTLAAICLLSSCLFVPRLGFYSDDWGMLQDFARMTAGERFDFARFFSDFGARPLQGLYLGALYAAFGYQPLGYHVVNAMVLAAAICLLYLVLLQLGMSRTLAFASAALTSVLPQLSTVRVWMSAYQIPLSMLLALGSMACQLHFARNRGNWWVVSATVLALLSVAAYEIFAPFMVLLSVLLAADRVRRPKAELRNAVPALVPALGLVAAGFAKGLVSKRLETRPAAYLDQAMNFFSPRYDWRTDYGLNLFAALDVHFRATCAAWLATVHDLSTERVATPVVAVGIIAAGLSFWRLSADQEDKTRSGLLRPFLIGLAAWIFGHGVFLVTEEIMFSPTGIANRVLVAAGIGVAIIIATGWAWATQLVPEKLRLSSFAGVLAALLFIAFCQTERAAAYWVSAAGDENRLLAAARNDLATVPGGSTVILDGVCPYAGPAIVMEAYWDSGGALSHVLGKDLRSDAVSPRMRLTDGGLATSIYRFDTFYPYGQHLFIYDPRVHLLTRLPDRASAESYFRRSGRRALRCAVGLVGHGVLI